MADIVTEIQRNLPGTDRDRYEIAYQRGRAQARSALVVGGLAVGAAVGAAATWLLDPERGAQRRKLVAERIAALGREAGVAAPGGTPEREERERRKDQDGREERVPVAVAIDAAAGDDLEVDDPHLVERVRTEIRAVLAEPDRVQVAALRDGVILRGEMQESEAAEVIARASKVRGVERVDDRTRHIGAGDAPPPVEELPVVR